MTDTLGGLTQEVVSGVALGCIYALIALGFTLIYKATEVVNFAQGELMMVGAYVNFFIVTALLDIPLLNGAMGFLAALSSQCTTCSSSRARWRLSADSISSSTEQSGGLP